MGFIPLRVMMTNGLYRRKAVEHVFVYPCKCNRIVASSHRHGNLIVIHTIDRINSFRPTVCVCVCV